MGGGESRGRVGGRGRSTRGKDMHTETDNMNLNMRIVAPYFVAGIEFDHLRVKKCAPIVRYMIEWSFLKVTSYCEKKKWEYEIR